jgi:hypothetical protein
VLANEKVINHYFIIDVNLQRLRSPKAIRLGARRVERESQRTHQDCLFLEEQISF